MKITKRLWRKHAEHGCIFHPVIGYVSAGKPILYESCYDRESNSCKMYRSEDNGQSFEFAEDYDIVDAELGFDEAAQQTRFTRKNPPDFITVDMNNNVAFRISNEIGMKKEGPEWHGQNQPRHAYYRPHIAYSYDEGKTWTESKQIIQSGDQYDETHWMDGVWFGKNACSFAASQVTHLSDSRTMLMMSRIRVLPTGSIHSSFGFVYVDTVALYGSWNKANTEIVWEQVGEPVPVCRGWSIQGYHEPTVAELPDGRLVVLLRMSWPGDESKPATKSIATSNDKGMTWDMLGPLRYEDDQLVHSPGSLPLLFYAQKVDKLYAVLNILPLPLYWNTKYSEQDAERLGLAHNPTKGLCDPRNKLHIVEIDMQSLRAKRDTVTIIEQRTGDEPIDLRLSNWGYHEDRGTGNLILYLTKTCEQTDDSLVSRDVYRYEISF